MLSSQIRTFSADFLRVQSRILRCICPNETCVVLTPRLLGCMLVSWAHFFSSVVCICSNQDACFQIPKCFCSNHKFIVLTHTYKLVTGPLGMFLLIICIRPNHKTYFEKCSRSTGKSKYCPVITAPFAQPCLIHVFK